MVLKIPAVNTSQNSVLEESFDHIGKGFQQILDEIEKMNAKGGISTVDAIKIQQSAFHYSMYQEIVTKIVSKSTNAINEVMKAQ